MKTLLCWCSSFLDSKRKKCAPSFMLFSCQRICDELSISLCRSPIVWLSVPVRNVVVNKADLSEGLSCCEVSCVPLSPFESLSIAVWQAFYSDVSLSRCWPSGYVEGTVWLFNRPSLSQFASPSYTVRSALSIRLYRTLFGRYFSGSEPSRKPTFRSWVGIAYQNAYRWHRFQFSQVMVLRYGCLIICPYSYLPLHSKNSFKSFTYILL